MLFNFLLITFVILFKGTFVLFSSISNEDYKLYVSKSYSQGHTSSLNELFYFELDTEEEEEKYIDNQQFYLKPLSSNVFFSTRFDFANSIFANNLFVFFSAPPLYILYQQLKSFLS